MCNYKVAIKGVSPQFFNGRDARCPSKPPRWRLSKRARRLVSQCAAETAAPHAG